MVHKRRTLLWAGAAGCCLAGCGEREPAPPPAPTTGSAVHVTSRAFVDGAVIPGLFTCDGGDRSPALEWTGAPAGTRSFAVIVHDPDAPSGDFTHWVLFDIPGSAAGLKEGGGGAGTAGANDFGSSGYGGPCPPPGSGRHHYVFDLYALDVEHLGPRAGASRKDVEKAMESHVLAKGTLTGLYSRK